MKLALILWIHLQSQANSKDEARDTRNKSTKKAVERERSDEATINELYDTR